MVKSASLSSSFFPITIGGVLLLAATNVSVHAFTIITTPTSIYTRARTRASVASRLFVATHTNGSSSSDVSPAPGIQNENDTAHIMMGPSPELLDLFNKQITQEFIAAQTYLSASIWFNTNDWEGMASYMLAESDEERVHGLGFVDFANKRNIPIELQSIPAPLSLTNWNTPEDVWQSILELEKTNTRSLLNLAEAANNCHDYAVLAFLNPFHMGQVNEEDKIGGILAKVRDENRTPGLLRSLDLELGGQAGN